MARIDTVVSTIARAEDNFNRSIIAASKLQQNGRIAPSALDVLRRSADNLYQAQLIVWQDMYSKAPDQDGFARSVPMPRPITISTSTSGGTGTTGLGSPIIAVIIVGAVVIGVIATTYMITHAFNTEASTEANTVSIASGATTERYKLYLESAGSRFTQCLQTQDFETCNDLIDIAEAPIQELPIKTGLPWWAHAIIWPSLALGVVGLGYVFLHKKQQDYRLKKLRSWF